MSINVTNSPKLQKEKLDPQLIKVALIMVMGSLAPLLDSTMTNVAIKTIASDTKSIISVVQWIATGYVLAMAIAVPVSGWASNRFGSKRVYMFSLFVFLVGSVLSAISWNIGSLIGFRIIQGIGTGLMITTLQIVIVHTSGGNSLGRLMSIVSIPSLLGPILGPVLGGIIVDSLSWRWIFYVNIPICIIALFMTWRGLPADEPSSENQALDVIGILLLSPAFAVLIYGISQIRSQSGVNSSSVIIPVLIGLVLLTLFCVYALRAKKAPVIDLHLFKSRNFSVSTVLLFISGIVSNGAMLLLPLYYQQVRGESVLFAGLWLIPQGVGMLLTRSWVGNLVDHIGSRLIAMISLVVTIVGTLPFAFAGADTNQGLLAIALLIRGAGMGGLVIVMMTSAYVGLRRELVPDASIATRIFLTIGGAFGSAILATILQHQLSSGNGAGIMAAAGAYNVAFGWSIGFTVVAVLPALLLPVQKNEGLAK